jgi:phospholipid/cholesterol/gamma-HCH transport system permease protein
MNHRCACLLAETGMATQIAIRTMVGLLGFFGALIISVSNIVRPPAPLPLQRRRPAVRRGRHPRARNHRPDELLVGIVIAQQGAVQLRQFGAEVFTINLIGRRRFKELGVLMTAIMVAGRPAPRSPPSWAR